MNPHAEHSASLVHVLQSLWSHRRLIVQMTRREIVARYQGSVMGMLWSLITPIFMLTIYTFVFSVVFKARWGDTGVGQGEFAIVLFAGLIVHGFFAEMLGRAPLLVLGNANYVKKVVFPLEILPFVQLLSAGFNALVSLAILLVAQVIIMGHIPWTALWTPVVLFPLLVLTLAVGWVLASLGVFLRDVAQTMGLLTTVLLFLSPVFFPVESLPEFVRPWMHANPLTFMIEQLRDVLIFGRQPHWLGWLIYLILAWAAAAVGVFWFQKTRKGFADVL